MKNNQLAEVAKSTGITLATLRSLDYDTQQTIVYEFLMDSSQSAISDFVEYPILYPGEYAEYTGFTENEVIKLCQKYEVDFSELKDWYDGYHFSGM